MVSWAFARIGIHRPSLCLPELLFSIRSFCHWISIVFLLYGQRIATHSVNPALTHFLGEFPGLGLDLIPDVVVPEADQRYTWSRKLDPNFCPGRDIPQTFASNARACKMLSTRAFEFSRLQCECLLNRSSRRLARTIDITHKVYLTPMVNIK